MEVIAAERLVQNSAKMGTRMGKRLDELKAQNPAIGDHRGLGLMRALEFTDDKGKPDTKFRDAVEQASWKRGLVLLSCGKASLRFIPSLTVTAAQVDGGMDVLTEAIAAAGKK